MKVKLFFALIMISLLIIGGCSTSNQPNSSKNHSGQQTNTENIELTISAAASLEEAFYELKPLFEEKHKNIKLLFNFGGSGSLQKQIIQGAPVDIFFSAAEDKFDELIKRNLIDKQQSANLLSNSLVLITPKESKSPINGFESLASLGNEKLALGTPEVVPAGNYGKQTLNYLQLWNQVQDNIVFAKDVRQVLTYVETGNVKAGLVYKTDALTSDQVKVAASADPQSHDPIIYPVGIVKATKNIQEAKAFYQFLHEDASKAIFKKYGFNVLD